jgi:hypothetical protein
LLFHAVWFLTFRKDYNVFVIFLLFFFALKMKALRSSETSGRAHPTTPRDISEDLDLKWFPGETQNLL